MKDTIRNHDTLDRRSLLKYVGAAGAVGLAGCAGGGTGEDGSGGGGGTSGELYFAQVKGALDFDPIVLNDVPSQQIVGQMFEGLYTYNEDATGIEPALAAGEPEVENNGQRYIVELNEDATFHNGDPVTAEDAAYSYIAPFEEETENAGEVDMIDSAEAIDEQTVQFDLSYPYGAFDYTLIREVVPQAVREEDPNAFNQENPIGSGPFQFSEWQEGEYVRIESYDDYWGENAAELDFVEFSGVEEQSTRVTSLQTGENDVIETIPPQLYDQVEGMGDVTIDETPGIGYFYLAFNCGEGPTSDPLVREAIDYCFSMDQEVANYVEPAGVRQYSPFPDSIIEAWDFPTDQWAEIPHDPDIEQAQQLFEEAGVPSDYNWRIIVPPDDMREQIGVGVGNGLQEAGFENVEVQRLDWGAFTDAYTSGAEDDFNMYSLGWSGSPDPEAFTYYMFAQENEGVTQGVFYDNDEVDQQIIDARQSTDREERRQLYIESTTTILEDRVHLPAYNLLNSYAFKDYVSGYQSHPVSGTIPLAESFATTSVE
ncbi:putative ABC transporter periplasmic-binding protein [Halalkalicoccus paucihalophilus]|uniref:Putative ABC transporter periplasmic-binding protein n=1 Tax=Halalkalicoccus paucihalophilus TaxID=1008153 RepID=A0A151AH69_9EURY|nr:ABC transporter substrate-binding protein [Halalkalicoccus paucihalophilus]KYH26892.1 putative ABC transporter periplasmic-binding protein [Halalkalicoccus paucihalophilus]